MPVQVLALVQVPALVQVLGLVQVLVLVLVLVRVLQMLHHVRRYCPVCPSLEQPPRSMTLPTHALTTLSTTEPVHRTTSLVAPSQRRLRHRPQARGQLLATSRDLWGWWPMHRTNAVTCWCDTRSMLSRRARRRFVLA